MLGLRTHVVVAVIAVLPGLLPLPPTKVKLTALPDSVRVIESESTAFSAIGLAPEFSTCARAGTADIAAARSSAVVNPNLVSICIANFILNRDPAQGEMAHTAILRFPPLPNWLFAVLGGCLSLDVQGSGIGIRRKQRKCAASEVDVKSHGVGAAS